MRYNENPFTCQCKKEEENAEGFQILHFYQSFLSDIIAVKGLKAATFHVHPCVWMWPALFWCGISLIGFSHTSGTQYVMMHKQHQVMGTFFFPPNKCLLSTAFKLGFSCWVLLLRVVVVVVVVGDQMCQTFSGRLQFEARLFCSVT